MNLLFVRCDQDTTVGRGGSYSLHVECCIQDYDNKLAILFYILTIIIECKFEAGEDQVTNTMLLKPGFIDHCVVI